MDDKNKDVVNIPVALVWQQETANIGSPHCETVKTGAEISCRYGHLQCAGEINLNLKCKTAFVNVI